MVVSYLKKWLITYALILTNFIVFVVSFIYPQVVLTLGFRPIYLEFAYTPQLYTLFTSMFVHSDFLHILGNMLVFFFIGMAFEQRIGWRKFLPIYLITGICGSLTHAVLNLGSPIPLVGASGAIFGIMGAFAYSYPNDEVVMPIPLGFIMIIRRIKVVYAVLIFAVMETIIVLIGSQDNTAHFAHIGGLISGVVIAAIILGRNKPTMAGINQSTGRPITPMYYEDKSRFINYINLERLATTPQLQTMLAKIKNESVPQVRDIWVEHFLEKATCPNCSHPLKFFNGKIWCDHCDFKSTYEGK
jgi:rhomboid protease GluP